MHRLLYVIGAMVLDNMQMSHCLEPWSDERRVPGKRMVIEGDDLERMELYYKTKDRTFLAEKMLEWNGFRGFVADGKLCYVNAHNPDTKFDWYEVGGRWNDIRSGEPLAHYVRKKQFPSAIVTPDGEWIDSPNAPWGTDTDEGRAKWLKQLKELAKQFPYEIVTVVDIHY